MLDLDDLGNPLVHFCHTFSFNHQLLFYCIFLKEQACLVSYVFS